MPRLKICGACGQLVPDGQRCACQAQREQRRSQIKHARGKVTGRSSTHWAHVRAAVVARDGGVCQFRLPLGLGKCGEPARSVHLDPRLGSNHFMATVDDCVLLCARHHAHVEADVRRGSS